MPRASHPKKFVRLLIKPKSVITTPRDLFSRLFSNQSGNIVWITSKLFCYIVQRAKQNNPMTREGWLNFVIHEIAHPYEKKAIMDYIESHKNMRRDALLHKLREISQKYGGEFAKIQSSYGKALQILRGARMIEYRDGAYYPSRRFSEHLKSVAEYYEYILESPPLEGW